MRVLMGRLAIGELGGDGVATTAVDLSAMTALRCLSEIHGDLEVSGTNNLTDLTSLSSLRVLDGSLLINHNAELRSLDGLEGIEVVPLETPVETEDERRVSIDSNPQLTNVNALVGLDNVEIGLFNNRLDTLPPFDWEHVFVVLVDNGLKDLAGLRGVTRLLGLAVYEPALANLQDLSALESADMLNLIYAPGPDLGALAKLRHVGWLAVSDWWGTEHATPIVSLHGLEGLTTLEHLTLESNTLKSLEGLSGVVNVTEELRISGVGFASLAGLDSLRHLTGTLALSFLTNATNMPGLERLETVGGLDISQLSQEGEGAAGLPALPALSRVTGDVMLRSNLNLIDLQNLGALSQIDGTLNISLNDALTDLQGLSALQRIGGDLVIGFNDGLQSLDGLSPGVELHGRLLVIGNSSLPGTSAEAFAESTGRSCDCDVYWTDYCARCDAPCACVAKRSP